MKAPFIYATQPLSLNPGDTGISTISVTREADFHCNEIRLASYGPCAILIRDSTEDKQWFNVPLHSDLIQKPTDLSFVLPRFIARGASITIEVVNLMDQVQRNNLVRLSLHGYKNSS